jgi:cellulose synthase/poly-beta-1,6-N-acetylglucosamine synthase-like glycosyltransferase
MVVALVSALLAVLLYTYAGYPILVALLARLFPLRTGDDPSFRPMVSVLIPVFNAAQFVRPKLDSLLAQDYPEDRLEVLVYSDGATDGSDDMVAEYEQAHPGRVRLLRAEQRSGKPTALNRMREAAAGEILVLTDIRQPLSENAVRLLVERLADPRVGCASGHLILRGATGAGFYWHYENAIRMSEARFRSMVGVTGPLYAMRKSDLPEVPLDTILDDMWIPMRLRLQGKLLTLCPEAIAWDQAFEDDRELGRKVRTLAGNYQLFSRLPRLLFPFTNPIWFETFSHKLLRLICPWVLVALLITSLAGAFMPRTAASGELWSLRTLVACEVIFIAAALVGARAGRITGAARTFVLLNWAAVVGLWRWMRGAQRITW